MSRLINELKAEHEAIVAILNNVKRLGVTSAEGQQELLKAKEGFLAHLKKEDEELYPTLKTAAETNRNLQNTLNNFASDMNEISQAALSFFDTYSIGGSGLEFAKDFGKLFAILKERVFREENIIYKKFDEL